MSKSDSFNKKIVKHKKLFLFLLGFTIVGSLIVLARAATVSDQLFAQNNLAYSYTKGGSVTIERDSDGNVTSYTRPRSIDVSKDEIVYCTPENEGVITFRSLTAEEKNYLVNDLFAQKPTISSVQSQTEPSVLDEPRLYIDGFIEGFNGDSYTESDQPALLEQASTYLEKLCSVPGQAIPSGDSPDIILSQKSDKSNNLFNTVAQTLVPKAQAGGTAPPPPPPGPEFAPNPKYEELMRPMFAATRRQYKLQAAINAECLNNAARDWSKVMAQLGYIRHTSVVAILPEAKCGTGWTWLGENVGVCNQVDPNNAELFKRDVQHCWDTFMASTGHRDNILYPYIVNYGIGAYTSGDGTRVYITQLFWAGRVIPK